MLSILRLAEHGYPQQQCDLFDDIVETDGHLLNLFEQRAHAVAGKPWVLQAGGSKPEDQAAAEILRMALDLTPNLVECFEHQLGYNRYGYAASEMDWDLVRIDGSLRVVPAWFANVPARRFRIGDNDELRLLANDGVSDGEPLAPGKWIVTRRPGCKVARGGLMRTAAWFAMYKRFGTRDWVVYAEKFGIPLVLASYDEASDENAKATAEDIVDNIGDDGGAVVPKGITVDIKDAERSGDSSGTHGGLIAHCNREMSKLVNGVLVSSEAGDGAGSYAKATSDAEVRWENVLYDAVRLGGAFRRGVCIPFMQFNDLPGAPPKLVMRVVRNLEPSVLVGLADTMKNKLGIDVSAQQLREITGLQEPSGPEDAAPGQAARPEVGNA